MARLKPYPAYRDSGVPWLDKIPAHWDVLRAKYLFREVDERSSTGEEELLSVSHITGVTPRSQKNITMFKAESYVGHKICYAHDLVINTMWAWMGALGVAKEIGLISPSYAVYRPSYPLGVCSEYLDHLLRTKHYVNEYVRRSTGIRSSRLRLYPEKFLDIPMILPSRSEQESIVAYLRRQNHLMGRYVRAQRKLIALLEEQKQAIIQRAVTRGLDPNVRLKPSGVEWLGDIPEHWQASRVKHEFTSLDHKRIPLSSIERGSMTSKKYDYYGASGVIDKVDDYLFDDELLLIAEDGANLVLRNLPLAIIARGRFWVNNHAHVLKPKRGNLDFLANLMESIDYRPWITGAAQPKLTGERLLSIWIPIPPVHEQHEIAKRLIQETDALSSAINHFKREIDLVREYRTCVISDVVTGKLDVRQAAANLPEEAEEPEDWEVDEAEGDSEMVTEDESLLDEIQDEE